MPIEKKVETPNRIFVSRFIGKDQFNTMRHIVIVIAASNVEVARKHIKEKIGIDQQPVWLPGAVYPIIWDQNGDTPEKVQAKILSNNNYTIENNAKIEDDKYAAVMKELDFNISISTSNRNKYHPQLQIGDYCMWGGKANAFVEAKLIVMNLKPE